MGWFLDKRKPSARRSTRLALQIPVIFTSLDPAYFFRNERKTATVNAHGCGIIVPQLLNHQTPVTWSWFLMARTRTAGLCLPSRFSRIFHGYWEWSLTAQEIFGVSKICPQTGTLRHSKGLWGST
jgi:hypothetical protein